MLADEATRCKHNFFLKKKSDQVDMVSSWLKGNKDMCKIQVKFIRCDNAGENKKLEEKCDAEGLGIIFEYTATGTPQQNAHVEKAFPTLMGRARAMMNFAGFTTERRKQLWCEAANRDTMLDNILVHEQNSGPPYTIFYGKDAKCAKHKQTFGEICVTAGTSNKEGRTKLYTRGRLSMFMGYSTQHAGDVSRFLHLKTNHVIYSRDVQWLAKMWNAFYNIPSNHSTDAYVDPFDDYIEDTGTEQEIESNVQEVEPTPIETEQTNLHEEEPIAARTRSHDSDLLQAEQEVNTI